MELDYERATESSDDGDSKQFMILLLVLILYWGMPRRNGSKRRSRFGVDGLLVSIMKRIMECGSVVIQ